jgi:hypothetical protein
MNVATTLGSAPAFEVAHFDVLQYAPACSTAKFARHADLILDYRPAVPAYHPDLGFGPPAAFGYRA